MSTARRGPALAARLTKGERDRACYSRALLLNNAALASWRAGAGAAATSSGLEAQVCDVSVKVLAILLQAFPPKAKASCAWGCVNGSAP